MTPEEQRSDDRYATLQAEHARTKDEVRRLQAELDERDQLNERLLADAKRLSADNAEVERLRAELAAMRESRRVNALATKEYGAQRDEARAQVERLTAALREVRAQLVVVYTTIPRWPSLGSMGGGSMREIEMEEEFMRKHGAHAETFRKAWGASDHGLAVADYALRATERALAQAPALPGEQPRAGEVRSSECSELEIVIARSEGRLRVDPGGFGYVTRPPREAALPGEAAPCGECGKVSLVGLSECPFCRAPFGKASEPPQAPEAAPCTHPESRRIALLSGSGSFSCGDCEYVYEPPAEAAPREEAPAKVRDEPVLGEVWESDMGSLRAAVQDAEHRLTYQARVDCATLKRVLNVLAHAPTEPREPPELPAGISLRMCHHGGSMTNDLTTYSYETRLYAKPKKWLCIDRDFKVTHEGFTPDEVAAVLAHHIARRAR